MPILAKFQLKIDCFLDIIMMIDCTINNLNKRFEKLVEYYLNSVFKQLEKNKKVQVKIYKKRRYRYLDILQVKRPKLTPKLKTLQIVIYAFLVIMHDPVGILTKEHIDQFSQISVKVPDYFIRINCKKLASKFLSAENTIARTRLKSTSSEDIEWKTNPKTIQFDFFD